MDKAHIIQLCIPYLIALGFMALDILTGIIKAAKNKELNSTKMREGMYHKAGSVLAMFFGVAVDCGKISIDFGTSVPVAAFIATYIVLMECASIIENLGAINPELVGANLAGLFTKLQDRKGAKDDDEKTDSVH